MLIKYLQYINKIYSTLSSLFPTLIKKESYTIISLIFLFICSFKVYAVELTEIVSLINQRLYYMEFVALFKYENNFLVEDLNREKNIINKIVNEVSYFNLDPATTVDFFQAQIDAAKNIQYRYLDAWRLNPPLNSTSTISLNKTIRPKLDQLNLDIINNISEYLRNNKKIDKEQYNFFAEKIKIINLDEYSITRIFNALAKIKYLNIH